MPKILGEHTEKGDDKSCQGRALTKQQKVRHIGARKRTKEQTVQRKLLGNEKEKHNAQDAQPKWQRALGAEPERKSKRRK